MRTGRMLACMLAGSFMAAPALAEPVAARCKVERTIDLGATPQKVERMTDAQRADPLRDWMFVYDLATGRLCRDGSEPCATNTTETAGEVKATLIEEGSGRPSTLILRPDGRWAHQKGLLQTLGGKGDCTLGAPTDDQLAVFTRNPAKDRDVLCAARLAVEADIVNSQGQSQQAQSILAWAQALLDRTNNRGYDPDGRATAVRAERAGYAARDAATRTADFAVCQARMAELAR